MCAHDLGGESVLLEKQPGRWDARSRLVEGSLKKVLDLVAGEYQATNCPCSGIVQEANSPYAGGRGI